MNDFRCNVCVARLPPSKILKGWYSPEAAIVAFGGYVMLRSFVFASLAFAMCAEAHANCRLQDSLEGRLGPGQIDQERGFTIDRPGGANFSVSTVEHNDRVKWRILRPNRTPLNCRERGPARTLNCNPAGRPPGYYKIFITNMMSHKVVYYITCSNP